MMSLVNAFYAKGRLHPRRTAHPLLLLNPVAPHITEEINADCAASARSWSTQPWPKYDEEAMKRHEVEIALQIAGKVKSHIMVPADMTREQAEKELPTHPEVQRLVGDKQIVKLIFVPGRLCNLILKG